jgi:periplasmic divalent cation tolerance protein
MWIYITTGTNDEAVTIGKKIVEERLAACANVLPSMQSIYCWEGKLTEDEECVLILKTTKEQYAKLEERVKELHSYKEPCIIALPIEMGSTSYLEWIESQTGRA